MKAFASLVTWSQKYRHEICFLGIYSIDGKSSPPTIKDTQGKVHYET